MEEIQKTDKPMAKPKFDESKLLPEQRKALEMAKAQGVKPIRSLVDLKLDIPQEELDAFADTLDEARKESRQNPPKDRLT